MKNKQKQMSNDIARILGAVVIIFFINIINQNVFYRFDLTAEKRYTLSENSCNILEKLDDIVFIRIYLDGELNIPFQQFQQSINDLLDEFKVYGKSMVQYEFVNPFENVGAKEQNRIIEELYHKGLRPTNIHQRDKEGGVSEKIIFPSAVVMYRDIELPLNLLLNNPGLDAEQNLNNSTESLEYTLISTIKNITNNLTDKIVFVEGHGELDEMQVNDISVELSKYYQIDRGAIEGRPGILDNYKAAIIAKPSKTFDEADKFVLDQYLMQGGKILWLIDAVSASLDSMQRGETVAFINDLNLDDLFFKYGVRINPELIQDIQCNNIPVNVALAGNTPNFQPIPWLYYPLLTPNQNHPASKNLNLVYSKFANPIDTLAARSTIKKHAVLTSSIYTKVRKVPAIIAFNEIMETPREEEFARANLIVGVVLEGEFESAFLNRGIDAYFDKAPQIIPKSKYTKMALISDGDIIENNVRFTEKGPLISPLGFDRNTKQTYGNKDFLINIIQYIADESNLLELRGREFKIRLLDKEKIQTERKKWMLLNMLVPSILVLLVGIFFIQWRKHRYSK